jgi:hypothetical protein
VKRRIYVVEMIMDVDPVDMASLCCVERERERDASVVLVYVLL